MILRLIFAFTVLFSPWVLEAQQSATARLDSLRKVAVAHEQDTVGVLALADLCYEYRFVNPDSAIRFGKAGIDLGIKLNYKPGLAQVYSDAAFIWYDRGEFDQAISFWTSALNLRSELGDSSRVASLQMKLGGAYFRKGEYETSLRHQLRALKIYEDLGIPSGVGVALNNVAAVYEQEGDLDKALEYYDAALALHVKLGNALDMGTTLINIGNVNFRRKDFSRAKKMYMRAVGKLSGKVQPTNFAIGLNNLSEIYVLEGRYDSAQFYTDEALALRRQVGDALGVISSLNMMGRINTKLGRYTQAEKHLLEALDSARRKEILPEQEKIYLNLHELYVAQEDWKRGLQSHIRYTAIHDSLLNEMGRKEIAALQVRYETDKKEQQIALQDVSLAEKEARIERDFVIIGGLLITLVLSGAVFALLRNRQLRKQDVARKEHEISLREAYIRASIESQENERKRFARDLHDGMGQWISSLRLTLNEIHSAKDDVTKLEVLERSDRILKDINHEFRGIAFNLMPHTLIHHGLQAALEEMIHRLNMVGKPIFSVKAFNFPGRLSELAEISLYRVIQEWTNNVIKFAEAAKVDLQLIGHDDELVIMIEDDGQGFRPSLLQEGTGNGWKNMNTRMNLVQGVISIDSSPAKPGTTFTLQIPLTQIVQASARPALSGIV